MKKYPNKLKVLILTKANVRRGSVFAELTNCFMCGEPMRRTRFMHQEPCWNRAPEMEKRKAEAVLELLVNGTAKYIILDLESRQFVSKK